MRVGAWVAAMGFWLSMGWAAAQSAPVGLVASPEPGWPQWRGPRRDGVSTERGLLQSWPAGGPARLWSAGGLGRGYSSPIVVRDRIYMTGEVGDELRVFALDLAGRPVWQSTNGRAWKGQFPGARASCTYSGGRIYHLNANGRVACLDAATGKELWFVDLVERFGAQAHTWGLSECLLVDGARVVVTPGGKKALLAALDARTGATIWTTPPLTLGPSQPPDLLRVAEPVGEVEGAGYASPILVRIGARRVVVTCTLRHLVCVDAETGKLLWTRPLENRFKVIALTPVLVGDAVFVTGPDGPGGKLFRLRATGDRVSASEVWTSTLDTCHGGAVCVGDAIYGSWYRRPAWGAIDARTGSTLFQEAEREMGSLIWADGRLYCLSQSGEMRLIRPTRTGFEVKGRFRLTPERRDDVWAHPVIADGRLYLRDHDTLYCYDVRDPSRRDDARRRTVALRSGGGYGGPAGDGAGADAVTGDAGLPLTRTTTVQRRRK